MILLCPLRITHRTRIHLMHVWCLVSLHCHQTSPQSSGLPTQAGGSAPSANFSIVSVHRGWWTWNQGSPSLVSLTYSHISLHLFLTSRIPGLSVPFFSVVLHLLLSSPLAHPRHFSHPWFNRSRVSCTAFAFWCTWNTARSVLYEMLTPWLNPLHSVLSSSFQIAQTAAAAGKTPQELCDEVSGHFLVSFCSLNSQINEFKEN